ncbi:MAG TPA: SBBP repeat-containing protein [Chitinophagales bacterium]|nr:SBBP repeat-containing protein [Chitinophagales bacterium]
MKNLLCALAFLFIQQHVHSQITRQWAATYNGAGDYNDRYTCVAADTSGNIYIGGSTVNPDVDRDYLVVKLNSAGVIQWNRQFKGTGEGPDEVTDITVDGSGNVYVTGFAKGNNTGTDYLTIKLNSNGDTLWMRYYNYVTANGYDQANSLFVDASGNVYVTGQSDGNPTYAENDDYATVKYSSSGVQQWVQRYNGLGNGTDNAEKIVADGSGNAYVTGRSFNGSNDDYVTIKYNSSGVQQWLKNDDRLGRDRATAMTIDDNDNIYITGRSSNGNNDDFWTLKYNSAGTLQWQRVYDFVDDDRAADITVDTSGNVYVTGESDADATPASSLDYQTVKYDPNGNQLWQARYDGIASDDDVPHSISVDGFGNVYVTGQSDANAGLPIINDIVTITYTSSGSLSWAQVFSGSGGHDDIGNAVVVLNNGCVMAGLSEDADSRRDAVAIAYNLSGTQLWQQTFNGIGDNNENIRSLAADNSGNVFAAGYITDNRTNRNMALVKFSSAGNYICRQTVDGTSTGSQDDAQSVALDVAGNPVTIGFTKNTGESNDITYYKTDANCNTIWRFNHPTAANGSDKIYDMVADGTGDFFYITGRIDTDPDFSANDDCFTAKLDTAGNIIWSQTYNSSGSNEDRGTFVRVASSGNVYVAGRTFNGSDFDFLILKYDNAGAQQWLRTYDSGNGDDAPNDFKIDGNENLYLCGISEEVSDSLYDYVTLKYNSSGSQQWVKKYNGTGNSNDEAEALDVDDAGNVYVTGTSMSAASNEDIVTVKYDATGNEQWVKTYNGSANADDAADDLAVAGTNQIIITGHTNAGIANAPNYNVITMLLNQNGDELWSDEYNGASDSSDVPNLIYVKGSDFYVAGSTVQTGQMRDMLVVKYSGLSVGMNEAEEYPVAVVYPNPFSHSLNIRSVTGVPTADFKLYDAVGRTVFTKVITGQDIQITVNGVADGIYFYFITSGGNIISKGKLVKLN